MAYKYYVILLPTIFTLKNVKVYIDISNSYNKAFYVETLINDLFNKLCESQILIYTIVILDLKETLQIQGLKAIFMLLKTWVALIIGVFNNCES